ncbi:MAG: universal stress protein [Thermoplasmatota archaeon]
MALVQSATKPVVTASARPVNRVVVPVEGSDREYLAQETAIEHAAALGVPVYAVHIHTQPGEPPAGLFTFMERLAARWETPLETRVLHATDAADEMLAELDPLDLVVLGSRRLGKRYHVGGMAQELIAQAPCPVQVVRLG